MNLLSPVSFLSQSIKSFHTTGALAPSSSFLAKAMVEFIPSTNEVPAEYRILEVGPGTGAFTSMLTKRLNGRGHLDLWEINDAFVKKLNERKEVDSHFKKLGTRLKVYQGDVRDQTEAKQYDLIVSGLPFNNFTSAEVRDFLEHFRTLLKPGGTLSYFEYVAIRKLQVPFSSRRKRKRLRGVADVVNEFSANYQVHQKIVPINMPPARVRHLRFSKIRKEA